MGDYETFLLYTLLQAVCEKGVVIMGHIGMRRAAVKFAEMEGR